MTWGVTDDHGGMTSALLHRSMAFARLTGTPIDVLTFDVRDDYPELSQRLTARGQLGDGVRIVNLWDWLREATLPADVSGSLSLDQHLFTPLPVGIDGDGTPAAEGAIHLSRSRLSADGFDVLQVDHYRPDGTLFASDRRDCSNPGELGGRSIVLCDEAGVPLRSWGGTRAFYRFWLDQLVGGGRAFMIVDSKTSASFMLTYRRRNVVTVHVVHASHLAGTERPMGQLRPTRREVFENLERFDSVVVLTSRQRDDVRTLLGSSTMAQATDPQLAAAKRKALKNLAVIPNSRPFDALSAVSTEPERGRGIVLAGLTARKRVDHAITAVSSVSQSLAASQPAGSPNVVSPADGRPRVTLDVYGDGVLRAELDDLAATSGTAMVTMHGHHQDARKALETSSFLIATGTSEGFPLVLVESMAAGCIPIAYDVPYGPADIITDGRNGYLVTSGDVSALADAILRFYGLPARQVLAMRQAAKRTARQFSDEAVTRLWARELTNAARRKAGLRVAPSGARAVLRFGKKAIRRLRTVARR
ncbi:MAG: glycosyltransferase [Glaciihabitans sp.]|nr:glycosyltransferase [Glaciihabitans sp.]